MMSDVGQDTRANSIFGLSNIRKGNEFVEVTIFIVMKYEVRLSWMFKHELTKQLPVYVYVWQTLVNDR